MKALDALLVEVEESAASSMKSRTRLQGSQCREEAQVAIRRIATLVQNIMKDGRKEWRHLAPQIRTQLGPGYDNAIKIKGKESAALQKASKPFQVE